MGIDIMQINVDVNFLNNIIGNTNIELLSNKTNISFENLILNCLDNKANDLEEEILINTDDMNINEEEISKILSLLNQIICKNENPTDTKNNSLNEVVENLNKSNKTDEKINLISYLIKNIDDLDSETLDYKADTFNYTMKELKSELNKIISNNSSNEEKPLDELDIFNINKPRVEVKKDTSNKELDMLKDIANNNDFEKINLNINNKLINNTAGQPHSIGQPSYKNIESNISYDTIKNIKYMDLNNIQELTINLRPKELGQMNIQLLKENNEMKVILTVHSKEALDLANKNISDIKGHLENANINIKNIVINMEIENTYTNENFEKSFSNNQNEQDQNNKNNKRSSNIDDEETKEIIKEDNLNLLA